MIVDHYFCALNECMGYLQDISLNENQIDEVKEIFKSAEEEILQEGLPPKKPIDPRYQAFVNAVKDRTKPDIGFYREALLCLERDLVRCKDPVEREAYLREIKNLKAEALANYPDMSW